MHNFAKKMKIQNYLCVDVKFESHAEVINEGESRQGYPHVCGHGSFPFRGDDAETSGEASGATVEDG